MAKRNGGISMAKSGSGAKKSHHLQRKCLREKHQPAAWQRKRGIS